MVNANILIRLKEDARLEQTCVEHNRCLVGLEGANHGGHEYKYVYTRNLQEQFLLRNLS